MKDDEGKDDPDMEALLHYTEPAKVLERRQKAIAGFYEAKAKLGDGEAGAPAVEERPVTKEARPGRRLVLPASWKLIAGCVVVAVAAPVVVVMAGKAKDPVGVGSAATGSAIPSAAPDATVTQSAAPPATEAPRATVSVDAGPPRAPSAAPTRKLSGSKRHPPGGATRPEDDDPEVFQ